MSNRVRRRPSCSARRPNVQKTGRLTDCKVNRADGVDRAGFRQSVPKTTKFVRVSTSTAQPRILVIDNYDSFVYTITGYLKELGADVTVVRNDAVPEAILAATGAVSDEYGRFDGVLVSPGPGTPAAAGDSEKVIKVCAATQTPMLGICLGHQALAEVYGAQVSHAPELRHGKTSSLRHDGDGLFDGLPSPFRATRYHSLAVEDQTVPPELVVTATTDTATGVVMGLQHRTLPLYGVQFHPESILTEHGYRLLANWLRICGSETAVAAAQGRSPLAVGI